MADSERTRTSAAVTRTKLMRAMEKLCARYGVENVTVKAILQEAGQKNESALHYHFNNKEGLIKSIHHARFAQTQSVRRELLRAWLDKNPAPTVHDLCFLLIAPTFQLCREDTGHRRWIKAFGARNAVAKQPILEKDFSDDSSGILIVLGKLKDLLVHLDEQMFEIRHSMVARFIALSMSNYANSKNAFRGESADFFFNNLIDVIAGIFTAEVSSDTVTLLK